MYISVKDGKIVTNGALNRSGYIYYIKGADVVHTILEAFCIIDDNDIIRCSFRNYKRVTVVEFCKCGLGGKGNGRTSLVTIRALGSTDEPGINRLMDQLSWFVNNLSLDNLPEEIEQEFATCFNDIMTFARNVYPDMINICRQSLFISGLPVDTFSKTMMKSSRSAE